MSSWQWQQQRSPVVHRAAALLLTCSFALSQVTAPTNSQNDENFVVRISVNLVQVDAVVTDSKGHPVTDLKAEDFEVLQDGIAQKVTNLSYINEGVKREVSNAVLRRRIHVSMLPTRLRRR